MRVTWFLPLITLLAGTVCFHVIAILFGAPIISKFIETFYWSLMMSCLIFLPYVILLPWKPKQWVNLLLLKTHVRSKKEFYCLVNTGLVVTGSWLGAVVLLLDWNVQWKVWPIPCCIGSLIGSVISVLIVMIRTAMQIIIRT